MKEEDKELNNLDLPSAPKLIKKSVIDNFDNKNEQAHNIPLDEVKTELKPRSKPKLKDQPVPVRIKSKFTASGIQFISDQLKGVIFSGWIGEREYIENLRAYRDIIEIDEWEDDLHQRLKLVMHGIKGVMEGTRWINITVPSSVYSCYCLWVLLDCPPFPGHYWLQINDVVSDSEFGLKLSVKFLREIHPFDIETKADREKRQKGDIFPDEWQELIMTLTSFSFKSLWTSMLLVITPSNISSAFRLFIVLSVTLVVAFYTFLKESWSFLLRFLREFGIFVHHATPFAQSVITFFEKLVGGFYLLLAMVYRDLRHSKSSPPPPPTPLAIGHHRSPPPLTYVPPQSWSFERRDSSD